MIFDRSKRMIARQLSAGQPARIHPSLVLTLISTGSKTPAGHDVRVAGRSQARPFAWRRLGICALAAIALHLGAAYSSAIEVYDYSSPVNDRYVTTNATTSGYIANTNPSYIGLGVDYSGILAGVGGNYSGRVGALIGSQYFVTVKHRADEFLDAAQTMPAYASIRVIDQVGAVHDYNVATITPLHFTDAAGTHVSDLVLGKLAAPITDPVAFYSLASPTDANVINRPIYVAGAGALNNTQTVTGGMSLGMNNVDVIDWFDDGDNYGAYRSQGFGYSYTLGTPHETGVVGGDSSGPSFVLYNGVPKLIGLHVGNTTATGLPAPNTSYDSIDVYLPYYATEISSLMAASGATLGVGTAPPAVNGSWNTTSSGSWNTVGNWSVAGVPGMNGNFPDTATFGGSSSANPVVTLDGVNPSVVGLTFSSSTRSYTIAQGSGGMLSLNNGSGSASITVNSGSHSISAPLLLYSNTNVMLANGTTLTISNQSWSGKNVSVSNKTGSGSATLNLAGTQSLNIGSTLTVGTRVVTNITTNTGSPGSGSTPGSGNLSIVDNGTINFGTAAGASAQNLAALTVNAGAKATIVSHSGAGSNANVLVTPSLTIASSSGAWTGALDISNNKLIVQSGSANYSDAAAAAASAAKASEVFSQVRSGFNGGAANTALLWTGNGINSSAANLDTRHVTGIGIIQNNDQIFGGNTVNGTTSGTAGNPMYTTFGGQAVNRNDILLMYTYFGDIDLNGMITAADYSNLDAAFAIQQSSGVNRSGWVNGDFDYNGVITSNDYALIDASFASQGGVVLDSGVTTLGGSSLSGGSSGGLGSLGSLSAVPEPSTLLMAVFGALGLLALARRRQRTVR